MGSKLPCHQCWDLGHHPVDACDPELEALMLLSHRHWMLNTTQAPVIISLQHFIYVNSYMWCHVCKSSATLTLYVWFLCCH